MLRARRQLMSIWCIFEMIALERLSRRRRPTSRPAGIHGGIVFVVWLSTSKVCGAVEEKRLVEGHESQRYSIDQMVVSASVSTNECYTKDKVKQSAIHVEHSKATTTHEAVTQQLASGWQGRGAV